MNRPGGVTVLAVLCFMGAAFCALGGIGVIAGGGFIATMMSQQGQGAGGAGLLAGLGAVLGVFLLVFAALYALVGWGLIKLKEWARIVTIILTGLGMAFQLLGLLASLSHFNVLSFIWTVFWLAIDALIIWYLLKPEVKAAFQGAQARAISA